MTTNKTIEEIVHNLNTGYYLGNGGEEAATQAIEALITEARADILQELLLISGVNIEVNDWCEARLAQLKEKKL